MSDFKNKQATTKSQATTYKGGHRSYAHVVRNNHNQRKANGRQTNVDNKVPFIQLECKIEEDDLSRFKKVHIRVVEDPGMSYNIQEACHTEGYFSIKVTSLRDNLCLLEEGKKG